MHIINLTPHAINFVGEDGKVFLSVPSSGVARAAATRSKVGEIQANGGIIPINTTTFEEVRDLPEPQPDTIYVVSALTAQAAPERSDLYITDDAVRDDAGRIIGCRALARPV